jgi:hypothetical protein
MRWTRWRRKTSGATRGRQSRVVLTPRRWRQVFAGVIPCASDGGKRARSPGRARNKLLKPLRREGWVFRQTCGDYARMLFQTLHARLRVLAAHPAFPAPSSLLGENVRAQLGRTPRRGMADVCRHCCRGILRDAACRPLLRMRSSQVGMKSPHVAKSAPHGEEAHRAVSNHQASRGERKSDPHGEEARRAVSNHEASGGERKSDPHGEEARRAVSNHEASGGERSPVPARLFDK